MLRPASWLISSALHGALAFMLVYAPGEATSAWQKGDGDDSLNIENAITLDMSATHGTAAETVQATEAQEAIVAQVPVEAAEEVKPVDELARTITSTGTPDDNAVKAVEPEEPKPVKDKIEVAAVDEQQLQIAREAQIAAAETKKGGDPAKIAAYGGEVWGRISKNLVSPRTSKVASVKVSFRVSPSGEVGEVQILSNTGAAAHEKATVDALKKAAPLPPLPVEWVGLHDRFSMEFIYSVR